MSGDLNETENLWGDPKRKVHRGYSHSILAKKNEVIFPHHHVPCLYNPYQNTERCDERSFKNICLGLSTPLPVCFSIELYRVCVPLEPEKVLKLLISVVFFSHPKIQAF